MNDTFEDDAAQMTRGEFATAFIYTRAGGDDAALRGIVDRATTEGEADGYSGPTTREATITVATIDLPAMAAAGDAVTLSDVPHIVRHLEADGTGVTRIALEVDR